MKFFDEVMSSVQENYKRHRSGKDFNCIPFANMERLEKVIPGIQKEAYYLLTANSGIGKSKLARHIFVDTPLQFSMRTGRKVKIFMFSLEESKRKFFLSQMSKRLYTEYGITKSINTLQSIGRHNVNDEVTIERMYEQEKYMKELYDRVTVIDYIKRPDDIAEYLYTYAARRGKFTYHQQNIPTKHIDRIPFIKSYTPHDPDEYVIFIIDHVKLMTPDKMGTIKSAIDRMSSTHCVNLRNICRFTPVLVQQQAANKEEKQYKKGGGAIQDKNVPTLDGLGEHKLTAQDCDVAMGLFAPNRYGFTDSRGYAIDRLRDHYRELSILKNRNGMSDVKLPLFFNGASSHFEELPRAKDPNIHKFYERAQLLDA